jgi:hypothetical protein
VSVARHPPIVISRWTPRWRDYRPAVLPASCSALVPTVSAINAPSTPSADRPRVNVYHEGRGWR